MSYVAMPLSKVKAEALTECTSCVQLAVALQRSHDTENMCVEKHAVEKLCHASCVITSGISKNVGQQELNRRLMRPFLW